ncbi:MAG: peptidoglycan DD-metalloendopeptidase family protein [Burkholderiaceae bacterium]|nr:peptidoglycan DD-metalloendopeptidase family protein [Burkholderiaceae bacterium]
MNDSTLAAARPLLASVLLAALLAACTLRGVREAPIVDKSRPPAPAAGAVTTPPAAGAAPTPAPLQRNASDGTYVVQRGDTLYSIAMAFGQDYRDLARWNHLDDPSRISVGQTLRVAPPPGESAGVVVGVVNVAPSAPAEGRPLEPAPAPGTRAPAAGLPASGGDPAARPAPTPRPAVPESGLLWQWPAAGKVIEPFADGRKGIGIAGNEGDAVLAASDGEVVYAGNGLRGYGNLVILKHSDDFISAYAHNRAIVVKQGQTVKRGQKIAELGKTDTTAPKLHFEIRHRGKPVDPLRYLPPR